MTTTSPHAIEQCQKRGLDIRIIQGRVAHEVARIMGATAVLVGDMPANQWTPDGSNGEQVWAIVRDGSIVTVMFRRKNQPATREALRVDTVLI